jgi:hypothetical protein
MYNACLYANYYEHKYNFACISIFQCNIMHIDLYLFWPYQFLIVGVSQMKFTTFFYQIYLELK